NIIYSFSTTILALIIYVDFEKVEIVLFNLLSNAFKFTFDDGVIIFTVQETGNGVTMVISDSGCGIETADRQRIFEKFQQAGHGKRQSGFGIGLFLVKQFIESHRGTVTCQSVVNKGTTFTITLLKGVNHFSTGSFDFEYV